MNEITIQWNSCFDQCGCVYNNRPINMGFYDVRFISIVVASSASFASMFDLSILSEEEYMAALNYFFCTFF